jgi:hypothetical protein
VRRWIAVIARWRKTTFDGARIELLRRAQLMSVRERLEAMDELAKLAERLRTMPKTTPAKKRPRRDS